MGKGKLNKRVAIIGGGPSALFMYKRLIESKRKNLQIDIFERKDTLGAGMPYSAEGANNEHITNVSDNEIPVIFNSIADWVKTAPKPLLKKFNISPENFNEYKVLPRLFFGEYLKAQFELLKKSATKKGIITRVHLNTVVEDVIDHPRKKEVAVKLQEGGWLDFDSLIICTGHSWPKKYEGKIEGYFDSPYPPKKMLLKLNHPVGLMGSSLTAIDAVRTLAKANGKFVENKEGKLSYQLNEDSEGFKLIMHSRNGLLPAIRFHLEDPHLGKDETLPKTEIQKHIKANGGFVSLDFLFEENFKARFIKEDPDFYKKIKDLTLEEFVEKMMAYREKKEPFELFKQEYIEAEKSIRKKESVYWKEALAILSFTMNYPAKYLSAEDMERLQKVLMPLISIVIAFVPQSSCRMLFALHDAGILDIVEVGDDSEVKPLKKGGVNYHYYNSQNKKVVSHFKTFVDCVGQPHLSVHDFPFKSLVKGGKISQARLAFKSADMGQKAKATVNKQVTVIDGEYYLNVPGITINDHFQLVDKKGNNCDRIYLMAVPYMGGYNPDYSGLDFCEAASTVVAQQILV
ncbi:FAD/NAD(P)-binding protein [Pedobacter ghigonis]|uniref:FAD/NAD(P)-binding protein n=1 Tax=Pedobacter ghigonis TaxID=2730403 RepID=UPI00158864D9|nr:FAD/NAD(P)-binding protein [Pedobacter ghigonis]